MQNSPDINLPYVIGLTGGIGCGKTTVSNLFTKLFTNVGVEVIDADEISKALVQPGCSALKKIKAHFGSQLLTPNGELDRSLLREIIFSDDTEKLWLENLLHPLIRAEITARISTSPAPYLILSAPLLLESEHYNFVNRILVVDIPPALQLQRALHRDGTTQDEIKKIMSAQMSREDRLARADDVIMNDQDVEYLQQQVKKLHDNYYREYLETEKAKEKQDGHRN